MLILMYILTFFLKYLIVHPLDNKQDLTGECVLCTRHIKWTNIGEVFFVLYFCTFLIRNIQLNRVCLHVALFVFTMERRSEIPPGLQLYWNFAFGQALLFYSAVDSKDVCV
jgi:hypothetical protein